MHEEMDIVKDLANRIIRDRRSTYPVNFDPKQKIDNAVITELLDASVWAPSHGLTQPWTFKVFKDSGIKLFFNKLKEIYREITPPEQVKESKLMKFDEKIPQVSHVIAVCMIRDKNQKYPEIEEIIATACVIENIYLCLNAYGIAGYLSSGEVCYTKQIKEFLGLGDQDHCLGFFNWVIQRQISGDLNEKEYLLRRRPNG